MSITYDRTTVRTGVHPIDSVLSNESKTAREGEGDAVAADGWDQPIPSHPPRIDGVAVGSIVGFDDAGRPLVDFAVNPSGKAQAARVAYAGVLEPGASVALMFEGGDPWKPIVIGPMRDEAFVSMEQEPAVEIEKDEESLTLTAKKQIVLRCGKASITLTRSGKILLRGTYILSRSAGVNAMKGGSVHIN